MTTTVLALETSCDECAAAIVQDGRAVLASTVASQVEVHAPYGGIVPEVAGREHLRTLVPVLDQVVRDAEIDWATLDAVAVTQGPGLGGSLLVGVNAAKAIAWSRGLPCIPVHHIEAHLYANWLCPARSGGDPIQAPPELPAVCLVVSGGHTELLLMQDHGQFQRLGQTRDDAAGEAFDKAGRLMGLPYPGGPAIDRAARDAEADAGAERIAPLPRARLSGTYDFSFSGLKTAVVHRMRAHPPPPVPALAREFQAAVVDVLAGKAERAILEFGARTLIVAGGVAANSALRTALAERCPVDLRIPPPELCTDNAAMIGAAAFYKHAAADPALGFDLFSTSGPDVFSPGPA